MEKDKIIISQEETAHITVTPVTMDGDTGGHTATHKTVHTEKTVEADKNSKNEKKAETDDDSTAKALKEAIHEQAREDEQPMARNFTLAKILGGDILSAQLIRENILLIIIIVVFIIISITSRYNVQKDLLELDKLETELKDAKYKALSSSSALTEKSRESRVLEMLKNNKDSVLKIASQPPFIINIPEK